MFIRLAIIVARLELQDASMVSRCEGSKEEIEKYVYLEKFFQLSFGVHILPKFVEGYTLEVDQVFFGFGIHVITLHEHTS